MAFLVRGITQFGESGVFLTIEETREDLVAQQMGRTAQLASTVA
jgi:hypothetical protein